MIAHFDLDSFFVSVERLYDPSLIGKPVAVGGSAEGRGVIASASYEARAFGVRSAMSTYQALQRCPELIVVPGRHGVYGTHSSAFAAILRDYSPLVEMASIDEAYVDFAGTEQLFGPPGDTARVIVSRVKEELSLDVSVGLSTARMVAKIAGGREKPRGFVVVESGQEAAWLAPLPIEVMPGVGPRTAEAMHAAGIHTLGELARRPAGDRWAEWGPYARGEVRGEVHTGEGRKGLSVEETFVRDLPAGDRLWAELRAIAEEAGFRLRREGLTARTIGVKLKDTTFRQQTAAQTLPVPSNLDRDIFETAKALAEERIGGRKLRLIGISLTNLGPADSVAAAPQLDLFAKPDPQRARHQNLQSTLDQLRTRYGKGSLAWGYGKDDEE